MCQHLIGVALLCCHLMWVLAIQVIAAGLDRFQRHPPGVFIFYPVVPPGFLWPKFINKEEQIGFDAGVMTASGRFGLYERI